MVSIGFTPMGPGNKLASATKKSLRIVESPEAGDYPARAVVAHAGGAHQVNGEQLDAVHAYCACLQASEIGGLQEVGHTGKW